MSQGEAPRKKKIRLGELLIRESVITEAQLEMALARQKRTGHKLGRALTDVGAISESGLHRFLAQHLGLEYLELSTLNLLPETVARLPEAHARRHRAIVLQAGANDVLVGMADPTDIFAVDELGRLLGCPVRVALVSETDLLRTIDLVYRRTDEIAQLAAEVDEELDDGNIDIDRLAVDDSSADAPVIRLLKTMFRDAVQVGASDIHIEPDESLLRIRQRVDGQLQENTIDGRSVARALVTRLKLMSGLDISEKRLPQDGRFTMRVEESNIDVRVSTLPVQHGESVVLRLLDQSANLLTMERLGMPPDVLSRFRALVEKPAGMILVTGPTGSGKTTTLYSALNTVNRPQTKIITAEDPVEYRLARINQVQGNARIGLTFARVLRTVLRQDPDIILVGEMRDAETVDIGLRAAMTGHLVFSTLHTNSAAATVSRLLDMGAEGYLIAAALNGVVAQRLVRRVCESCVEPDEPSVGQRAWLEATVGPAVAARMQFRRGRGCTHCQLTGYHGRIGVYELLSIDETLAAAIRREDPGGFSEAAAASPGYVPLTNCALDYAANGITSLDEVVRLAGGIGVENDAGAEPVPEALLTDMAG